VLFIVYGLIGSIYGSFIWVHVIIFIESSFLKLFALFTLFTFILFILFICVIDILPFLDVFNIEPISDAVDSMAITKIARFGYLAMPIICPIAISFMMLYQ
jgi:hypothetical protein